MRKVWIPSNKSYALVDNEDYERVSKLRWHVNNSGYVICTQYVKGSGRIGHKYTLTIMSRMVMYAQKGQVVDHINGNKKDNRKENLRLCTQTDNSRYRKGNRKTKSGYKGVTSSGVLWYARLRTGGKVYDLGLHETPELAAQAYNAAAIKHYGEFAYLNKIKRVKQIDITDLLRDKGSFLVVHNLINDRKMYWGKRFWHISENGRVIRKTEQKRVAMEYLMGIETETKYKNGAKR